MTNRKTLLLLISQWSYSQGGSTDRGVFSTVTCTHGSKQSSTATAAAHFCVCCCWKDPALQALGNSEVLFALTGTLYSEVHSTQCISCSLKCPLPVALVCSGLTQTLDTESLGLGSGSRTEILSTFWWFLLADTCRHRSFFVNGETEARLQPPLTALSLCRKSAFLSFINSSFRGGEGRKKDTSDRFWTILLARTVATAFHRVCQWGSPHPGNYGDAA